MYELAITRDFIARHYLTGGDWGAENQVHSHHYRAEIRITGERLDRHGYLIDIVELDRAVTEMIAEVRERVLNELPAFSGLNPSLEHFARILWEMLNARVSLGGKTVAIKLWESERDWAAYSAVSGAPT